MAKIDTDRNLLFGLLALQNGLIDQVKLVAAFQAWTLDKVRPLADHLVARGDLDADDRSAVEALVARHHKKHGDSTEKSLAAIPAVPSLQRSLLRIADPDLGASLAVRAPETDGDGTLSRIFERTGAFAGITLAGADPDPEPALAAGGPEVLDGSAGRYQILGEIARGGMGSVLRARDPHLGRDLALKVLLDHHRDRSDLVDRFVEEAQICGQLQHPGVVPVYELSTLADHRPFFTMKLVKGQTLAALLAERVSPAHDLPRFLAIFEAICQTVAYAHARGVIHRDLKPSNVMVGSFGEVQVMDWGLAKVLKEGGVADEPPVQPAPELSVIATVRSGSDVDDSHAGSVLGTPAYMAPEQAAGEVERVERRADVFGLGSILCELLTGQPAYTGRSSMEILRKAMRGDTADALARLESCGAEAELIALVKDCLAAEPEDRPRDAGLVADRITAYVAGVQARVQAAERERAVAVARAIEERRRRKPQLGLAASVVALTTLGGLSTMYYLQQRPARAAAIDRVVGQAVTLRDQ
ncbi:MAG TPA: serine/threonine-protein kinase, partial [Isosphaeraceae bacterium]|nr:serine/threonine-protein kinase [Isosphaeraceae bacterium]